MPGESKSARVLNRRGYELTTTVGTEVVRVLLTLLELVRDGPLGGDRGVEALALSDDDTGLESLLANDGLVHAVVGPSGTSACAGAQYGTTIRCSSALTSTDGSSGRASRRESDQRQ